MQLSSCLNNTHFQYTSSRIEAKLSFSHPQELQLVFSVDAIIWQAINHLAHCIEKIEFRRSVRPDDHFYSGLSGGVGESDFGFLVGIFANVDTRRRKVIVIEPLFGGCFGLAIRHFGNFFATSDNLGSGVSDRSQMRNPAWYLPEWSL